MKKKIHRQKSTSSSSKTKPVFILEYYQRPFALFSKQLQSIGYDIHEPHPIRKRFWKLIACDTYDPEVGNKFLKSYLVSVENEMANKICNSSIAFYIHLYRRLFPSPIGDDKQPRTIILTRAILESAIQKYACFNLCKKIAKSADVPIKKVFSGILMAPEFKLERDLVSSTNQLVLTDFSVTDVIDFYELEKLAYEIWKTSAALRTLGKGSPLIVDDPPNCFYDGRSSELDFLLFKYDERLDITGRSHTASGVVFNDIKTVSGVAFIPTYNVGEVSGEFISEFMEKFFETKIDQNFKPNFVWYPFNFREYYQAHLPFSGAFKKLHGVSLEAVMVVVAALVYRVVNSWFTLERLPIMRFYQRAYELCTKEFIKNEILALIPVACKMLEIQENSVSDNDIQQAIDFWTLTERKRRDIDLSYPGLHNIFLPCHQEQVLVDYAWIDSRLYNLFFSVNIPDENFKAEALETIVGRDTSILPTRPCINELGEKRQIDYAAKVGSTLVIVECKAVRMSIAFDRGDPDAIRYRRDKVVERSLREVDIKAKWLVKHPLGRNYDIRKFTDILPIAVSPFVEFIHSTETRYWLSKDVPRVLTPAELKRSISNTTLITNSYNKVKILK